MTEPHPLTHENTEENATKHLNRATERSWEEIFDNVENEGSMRLMTSARPEDIRGRTKVGFVEDVTHVDVFRSMPLASYAQMRDTLADNPNDPNYSLSILMRKKGIHELVDFTPILKEKKEDVEVRNGLFRKKTIQRRGTGEMLPVLYSDLRADGKKEPAVRMTYYVDDADWKDYSGRTGQMLSLEIMLPASLAKELVETLRKYPSYVRELVRKLIATKIGATPEGLEAIRPRFEVFDAERPANEAIRIQESRNVATAHVPSPEEPTAENEPTVVMEETPRETEEETPSEQEPDAEPAKKMQLLFEGFKSRADKFLREHFKGEYVEGQGAEMNKTEITKAVGVGMIGAAASLGGIKSFADLPRWFAQKYYTKQEQERIKDAIDKAVYPDREHATLKLDSGEDPGWEIVEELDDGKIRVAKTIEGRGRVAKLVEASQIEREIPPSPVEIKKRRIERAVRKSKYLSEDKKKELLQKLQDTVETYDNELETYETTRNEQIAQLLDEAIQTRVKGSTALKETLNTAMLATGLNVLRGAAYGAVALYERGVKIKQERAEKTHTYFQPGDRTESFAKELFVKVFTETWDKLRFKTGETKTQKALNFAQALGTVARFAGFTSLAIGEMSGSGGPSAAIENALAAFEQKGLASAAADNVSAHFERLYNIATFSWLKRVTIPNVTDASETMSEESQTETPSPEVSVDTIEPVETSATETPTEAIAPTEETAGQEMPTEETVNTETTEFEPLKITAGQPLPDELSSEELAQEVAAEQEAPLTEEELAAGTAKRGDGVIRIVQRQLKLNPEKYGYTGDVDDKKAVAKWVRKTAFGITKQSGFVNQDGWLGVRGKAIDHMTLGLSKDAGGKININFYDTKSGDQMNLEDMREKGYVHDYNKPPVSVEVEAPEPQVQASVAETEPVAEPPAVEESAAAEPTVPETVHRTGLPDITEDTKIVTAGADTEASGLPDITPETAIEPTTPPAQEVAPAPAAVTPAETLPPPEVPTPLETFKSDRGSIQFKYDGDKISTVEFEYSRSGDDIDHAAERFGTGSYEVHRLYTGKFPSDQMWRANAPAEAFLDSMERETRIEAMMKDMASKGLKDTPEYKYLDQQAGRLKGVIKQTFKELGMNEQVDQVDRAALTVQEQTPTDEEIEKLRPPEALEEERRVQPAIETAVPVDEAAAAPPPEQPTPELTKGPGGLEFTSDYTTEEQAKIADYIHRGRLEKAATFNLLTDYQAKYGDRPQFAAFKDQVQLEIDSQDRHLDRIVQQVAGKAEGHPKITMGGNMSPEDAAKMKAQAIIAKANQKSHLLSAREKANETSNEMEEALRSLER